MKILTLVHTNLPGIENRLRISVGTPQQDDILAGGAERNSNHGLVATP